MRSALVIVICLVAAACSSTGSDPRPRASGFGTGAGVVDPYGDGKQHLMAGRYQLAIERFGQALARDGRSLDALNGLAVAHTRLGRFDVAQTYFERALQVDPTSAATLNNYGWSLIEQGRLREASPFLELALRHAAAAEAQAIAANIESMHRARPPGLVAALKKGSGPGAPRAPHRLIRVDDNAYRLETSGERVEPPTPLSAAHAASLSQSALQQNVAMIGPSQERAARPDARSAQSVTADDVGAAGFAPAAVEHVRAAEPERDIPVRPPSGGAPIQLWPQPVSESEAGPLLAGDEE